MSCLRETWASLTPRLAGAILCTVMLAFAASIPYSWSVLARSIQSTCPAFPDNALLVGTVVALTSVTIIGTFSISPRLYRRSLPLILALNSAAGLIAMGLGVISTALCIPWLLFAGAAFAGVTTTFGYYTGVTLLVEFFPKHRGFAASWYGGALGIGSAVFSAVEGALLHSLSVLAIWGVLTGAMALLTLPPVLFLRKPTSVPAAVAPTPASTVASPAAGGQGFPTFKFALFWLAYFGSLAGGWASITALDLVVRDVGDIPEGDASFRITSGILWAYTLARFASGPVSDMVGQDGCYLVATAVQVAGYASLPALQPYPAAYLAVLGASVFMMGSAKVMVASFIFKHFGGPLVPTIFGYSMSAFGVAGIVGSLTAQRMYTAAEADGGVAPAARGDDLFRVMAGLSALGFACFAALAFIRALERGQKVVALPTATESARVALLTDAGSAAEAADVSAPSDERIMQLTRSLSKGGSTAPLVTTVVATGERA